MKDEFSMLFKIVAGAVFAGAALVAVDGLTTLYKARTAAFHGKANAEVAIESSASRIANYNAFYDQCASIQGMESAIKVQEASLAQATAPEDQSRIHTVIAGIKAQRGRAIAQYNADARKSYTAARFLASDLPFQIDDSGAKTSCVH